jgi:hypothetical protein
MPAQILETAAHNISDWNNADACDHPGYANTSGEQLLTICV